MKSYPGLGKWAGERVTVEGFVEENRIDNVSGRLCGHDRLGCPWDRAGRCHARSYGKCVIASSVGHLVEDIEHLKTGIVTENDRWDEGIPFCGDESRRGCPDRGKCKDSCKRTVSPACGNAVCAVVP